MVHIYYRFQGLYTNSALLETRLWFVVTFFLRFHVLIQTEM